MKLYFTPGACSMASHIVAREAGIPLEVEAVDLRSKRTASGQDFYEINPKGYVPALLMDDGELLTESAVILQFIGDLDNGREMLPPVGSRQRYRVLEIAQFVATEIHKGLGPVVNPSIPDDIKAEARAKVSSRIALIEESLATQPFVTGNDFTIADAYAFTIIRSARKFGVDLTPFPHTLSFLERIKARPAVQATMAAEGLTE